MNLRIVTVTRGTSPYLDETAASVTAAVPSATYVLVAPAATLPALNVGAHVAKVADCMPGLYANLNHGVRAASGEWDAFTWINDDDVLRPPGFRQLLAQAERRPEVDVWFGRVDMIDSRGGSLGMIPVARSAADLPVLFARGIIPFAQPGTVIRRGLWERLGGIDESYALAGDSDFFIRALAAGARFGFVNATVAAFRLTPGQLSKRRQEVEVETARAIKRLQPAAGGGAAVWRFRAANVSTYLDRLRRHGWKSMREIYDQGM